MKRLMPSLLVLLPVLVLVAPAQAGLLGDTIQGEMLFPELTGETNLFDPANGLVPVSGVNPDQPSATVIDPDEAFPEFTLYSPTSTQRVEVDVDDLRITITWSSFRDGIGWYGQILRLNDLQLNGGQPIQELIQRQNDASADVSWDDHSITITTVPGGIITSSRSPSYLILDLSTAVPTTTSSFSRIKSLYR